MFLVIAIASCTSNQQFGEIYNLVARFLLLSETDFSTSLRQSPGFGHFVCYALLCFSLTGVVPRRRIFLAPLIAILYGLLMELVQAFIPSRFADVMDMGINILGVATGFGLYWLVRRGVSA